MADPRKKPPIGLRPRKVVVQARTVEILEAMIRYVAEGREIPEDWRKELDDLLDDTEIWGD